MCDATRFLVRDPLVRHAPDEQNLSFLVDTGARTKCNMASSLQFLLCTVCLLLVHIHKEGLVLGQSMNLSFMLMTSFGEFGLNSSGIVPAVRIALEDINESPDVLPGYNLTYDEIRNSQVSIKIISYLQYHNYLVSRHACMYRKFYKPSNYFMNY